MFRDTNLKVTFGFTIRSSIAATTLKLVNKVRNPFLGKFRTESILDSENYF